MNPLVVQKRFLKLPVSSKKLIHIDYKNNLIEYTRQELKEYLSETILTALDKLRLNKELLIDKDLWDIELDYRYVRRIITNILYHASRFFEQQGAIRVYIENHVVTSRDVLPLAKGKYIRVLIKYESENIDETSVRNFFASLFKSGSRKRRSQFAVYYSLIKKFSGYSDVWVNQGKSAAFYIYLPAQEKDDPGKSSLFSPTLYRWQL